MATTFLRLVGAKAGPKHGRCKRAAKSAEVDYMETPAPESVFHLSAMRPPAGPERPLARAFRVNSAQSKRDLGGCHAM